MLLLLSCPSRGATNVVAAVVIVVVNAVVVGVVVGILQVIVVALLFVIDNIRFICGQKCLSEVEVVLCCVVGCY